MGTEEAENTGKATESIKTRKSICLEKNNTVAYFIGNYKEDDFIVIYGNAAIAKSAFAYSNIEKILFKGCSPNIGERAFENCESLTTVIFGELENDGTAADKEQALIKNLKLASADGDYVIQTNAFKGCGKLTTLVLPSPKDGNSKLVIEKDAFFGCGALRTVVAIYGEINVTGNPFADSPEHLTFVCKKDSGVARFARENGYRSVYVG